MNLVARAAEPYVAGYDVHLPQPVHRPATHGPYAQLAEIDPGVRKLLVLSGQCALDDAGNVAGGNDMRARTRFVFDVIDALLTDRGASFTAVVNVRTYLTDMDRLKEYTETRGTYFGDRLPTSTTVEVSRLVPPVWVMCGIRRPSCSPEGNRNDVTGLAPLLDAAPNLRAGMGVPTAV